jgi:hypothetical protein
MPKPNTTTNDGDELARLRAENAALKAAQASGQRISYRVSEKGALSVYGLGRWPVTLYRSQWERLLAPAAVDGLRGFIEANAATLAVKE